jgi:crossover junction endodeoxyribonuclease RuvC
MSAKKQNFKLQTLNLTKLLANERIILGIDPGTTIMGFGLIKVVNKKWNSYN